LYFEAEIVDSRAVDVDIAVAGGFVDVVAAGFAGAGFVVADVDFGSAAAAAVRTAQQSDSIQRTLA
jgi:hypothetical protein